MLIMSRITLSNIVYTATLLLNTFAFGLCVTMFNSCLTDLKNLYEVDQSTLTMICTSITGGTFIGTLSGLFYGKINRQLTMALFALVLALTTTLMPYYAPLTTVYVCLFINGISVGVYNSSITIWFTQMWPRHVNAILQANQFVQGLGAIAAPLIASRFVFGEAKVSTYERMHALVLPFGIAGLVQALASFVLLVLYFVKPYKYKRSLDEYYYSEVNNNDQICLDNLNCEPKPEPVEKPISSRRNMVILSLCCLFLAIYSAAEDGYAEYATEMWQFLPIHLSGEVANQVYGTFSALLTIGPLFTAALSLFVSPDCILAYHFVIIVTGYLVLYFCQQSLIWIYIGSAILGYGFSAMEGAILAMVEHRFTLTDNINTAFQLATSLAQVSFNLLLIQFPLDIYPGFLFTLLARYIGASLILFIVVKCFI